MIGIEANTSLQDTKLTTITHTLSLCDLITAKYGQNTPLTHSRGRKTIDHILTSHQISSTTQNCGILPFYKFFDSHHRGIYADLPNKITSGGLNYSMQERRKSPINPPPSYMNTKRIYHLHSGTKTSTKSLTIWML